MQALLFQFVKRVDQHPHHEAHQEFRDQLVDEQRDCGVHDRHREEQLGNGQAALQNGRRHERGHHHEQRIEDVVGGDDAGAVVLFGARLHHGVERHGVEAGEHREQKQVHHHAPVGTDLDELGRSDQGAGLHAARGKIQINGKQRHAERAKRHQPDLDLVAGHFFAQHGAEPDADGENGQQQCHDLLVSRQDFLGKTGKGGQENGPEEPQP